MAGFLVEFRVAQAIMRLGNLEIFSFQELLESGDISFSLDELKDFEKCSFCSGLAKQHKDKFISVSPDNFSLKNAINRKLTVRGLISSRNRVLARPTIDLVGTAAQHNLSCVLDNTPSAFVDRREMCAIAQVLVVPIEAFVAMLRSPDADHRPSQSAKDQLEDAAEAARVKLVASALGIRVDELDALEWRLDENSSADGLVYGCIVTFEDGSDPAILDKIAGLIDRRWVPIGPL